LHGGCPEGDFAKRIGTTISHDKEMAFPADPKVRMGFLRNHTSAKHADPC
jgi:hypothetical protein